MNNIDNYLNEKSSHIKKGDKVKISPKWAESKEEAAIVFDVLSDPNSNNRVDIQNPNSELTFKPIESVSVKYLIKQ